MTPETGCSVAGLSTTPMRMSRQGVPFRPGSPDQAAAPRPAPASPPPRRPGRCQRRGRAGRRPVPPATRRTGWGWQCSQAGAAGQRGAGGRRGRGPFADRGRHHAGIATTTAEGPAPPEPAPAPPPWRPGSHGAPHRERRTRRSRRPRRLRLGGRQRASRSVAGVRDADHLGDRRSDERPPPRGVGPLRRPDGRRSGAGRRGPHCVAAGKEVVRRIGTGRGGHYVEVHNAEFPDGALRGDLSP